MSRGEATWRAQALRALAVLARRQAEAGPGAREWHLPLADPPDPFTWLELAPAGSARAQFGADRTGLGAAWRLEGGSGDVLARPCPFAARWLSWRFDPDTPAAPAWSAFGSVRVWAPRFEWRAGDGLVLRQGEDGLHLERRRGLDLLGGLAAALSAPASPATAMVSCDPARETAAGRRARTARHAWTARVEEALAAIADPASPLDKLVLARARRVRLAVPAPGVHLLRSLAAREPGVWPYLLAWPGGPEWLGATPEWLYRRRGRQVAVLALAGTRPRGVDAAADRRLARELLGDDKERREHGVVEAWLAEALAPLLEDGSRQGALRVRRLGSLQHLERVLRGRLRPEVHDGALLAALHPTPALCGRPRGEARAWLRAREPQDRGLYGGVLGVLEPGRSHCRVAIRGALRRGRELCLWAGAGVVAGSRPEREWAETDLKLAALASRWGMA